MEEDIKNLSEIIELCEEELNNNDENVSAVLDLIDLLSLRRLIKTYKDLKEIEKNHKKENGELRERVKDLEENINKQKQLTKIAQTITDESIKEALIEFEKDYIPVSLVKEKIEELKRQRRELGFKTYLRREDMLNDDRAIICETRILQELLEKRK